MTNPIESLASSLDSAINKDLLPVEYSKYEYSHAIKSGSDAVCFERIHQNRPRPEMCEVTLFIQTWSSTTLGFGGMGGQTITSAYTTIVQGPKGDFCVYFAGKLAYKILHANNIFHEDVMLRRMHGVQGAKKRYEYETDINAAL